MILFYKGKDNQVYAIKVIANLNSETLEKFNWLFNASFSEADEIKGKFLGSRKEIITPWSTNAVEITQNMGVEGIERIEVYTSFQGQDYDKMLLAIYENLDQDIFKIDSKPEPVLIIENIVEYNRQESLTLSDDEIVYLEKVSDKIGCKLTDSEVFGFSQINSEHCRHKIFNGKFIIDGEEKENSLFQLIKKTSKVNPNKIVSAYKDNVSFVSGSEIEQFAPERQDEPAFFEIKKINAVLSLKAETHNFPTTVEPFNGAATGSGGEIRDRMAGGKGSIPVAGTAVYMVSYPRIRKDNNWEKTTKARKWLYQSPIDILIKASNGTSDFGNKFGQPLINGSLLTFEHYENNKWHGYDKVIMLAGGIGFAKLEDSKKERPQKGDKIVVLGGDNYRIGMGGSAVSSVATGEFNNAIELNAIQRSNPEMQKRVANVIRALAEATHNPIVSIHDHGAGGHLNCLSELVEETGAIIDLDKLPIGDPTLSAKEIIGNESQERIGLVIKEKDISLLQNLSDRERTPMYVVGEITNDMNFKFESSKTAEKPINLNLENMFGKSPKTILKDETQTNNFDKLNYGYTTVNLEKAIYNVMRLEAVASKDWLTNKVDRSVTGKVACQQTAGAKQLPLNNLGVIALDYRGIKGLATSLGHAPIAALADTAKGSRLAIAEALTNIVWAPMIDGIKSISLSANWMWPSKNKGEDARLYEAVKAVSDFACGLGVNIPTGKDSLSMVQKYADHDPVYAPGTVIISASGEISDIKSIITPVLEKVENSSLLYINFSKDNLFNLGGSSYGQSQNKIGQEVPDVKDVKYFSKAFDAVQELVKNEFLLAGHDISAGGLITNLSEMTFSTSAIGLNLDFKNIPCDNLLQFLFSETPGVIVQVKNLSSVSDKLKQYGIDFINLGTIIISQNPKISIQHKDVSLTLDISSLRANWMSTSYHFDIKQVGKQLAKSRISYHIDKDLSYKFPSGFTGQLSQLKLSHDRDKSTGIKAAIIREKGVNGDREMAYAMWLAGFDVKDVHITDLISEREKLEDVNFIVFVGGFSNSDVLGSAKGWAGAFKYNPKAKQALDNFYKRKDTLSLGVCNGCQLMIELGLIHTNHTKKPKMESNYSRKFESIFLNVSIPKNDAVMLSSLAGSDLGVWVAHGEGRFVFPKEEKEYNIIMKYSKSQYPGNPNKSDFEAAGIVSDNGRHLAMMPHLERTIFPWQCGFYPSERKKEDITPWLEPFVNARKWVEEIKT